MVFKKDKCPKCGNFNIILPSNNPIAQSVCQHCIISNLNYNNIEDADFFCRTFNYAFDPEKWILLSKMYKEETFKEYILWVQEEEEIDYETKTKDIWKQANEEWSLARTHEEIIEKIAPIKEAYLLRNRIKWGSNYLFEELIGLENLFVNTLKANNISNPMQVDAIKKACKMSVQLDRAIVSGASEDINKLSKAYQNFIKTAQIDEIITRSSKDVIATVADLVNYLEENNFEFNYYDGVDRDVVDKSMKDIKEYIKRVVLDSTGLEIVFENINESLKQEKEIQEQARSYTKVPLEELYEKGKNIHNEVFDRELADDDVEEGDMEEEDYEYFEE